MFLLYGGVSDILLINQLRIKYFTSVDFGYVEVGSFCKFSLKPSQMSVSRTWYSFSFKIMTENFITNSYIK